MKKVSVLLALVIIVLVSGCNIFKNSRSSKKTYSEFSIDKDLVLHKGKPYAKLQAMTWSLDGGELVKEMNFKLLDEENLSTIGDMIDFLSDRHQSDEIEVEVEVPSGSNYFKL